MRISGEEIFRQKEDKPSVYVCVCVRVFIYMTNGVVHFGLHTLMPGRIWCANASSDVLMTHVLFQLRTTTSRLARSSLNATRYQPSSYFPSLWDNHSCLTVEKSLPDHCSV